MGTVSESLRQDGPGQLLGDMCVRILPGKGKKKVGVRVQGDGKEGIL